MTWQNEIQRWSMCPDDTGVWFRLNGEWILTLEPSWDKDLTYIVNDEYAEYRKSYYEDKKSVQVKDFSNQWVTIDDMTFDSAISRYRFTPNTRSITIETWVVWDKLTGTYSTFDSSDIDSDLKHKSYEEYTKVKLVKSETYEIEE